MAQGTRSQALAKKTWCIPKLTEEFRERMDDVLDQYEKPLDRFEPVICLDEQPYQLLDHTRPSQAAAPGKAAKQDYEYRRCGTCSIFVAVEPKAGRRYVQARRQRKRLDFARFVRDLLQKNPRARRIHLVLDNLNTHDAKSLVQTFGEKQAKQLLKRIVWHHTPKHASWLNMAEIEIGVFERECLARRIESRAELEQQVAALEMERNRAEAKINWQFTCEQARITLQRLYPKLAGFEELS